MVRELVQEVRTYWRKTVNAGSIPVFPIPYENQF